MPLSPQDIIRESIRRYQREKLFYYYDQLEKKEDFEESFYAHLVILTQSIKHIISKQQMSHWLGRVEAIKSTLMHKKELHTIKEHVETFLEDDFLKLFDGLSLDTLSPIINTIDSLEVPILGIASSLPESIQEYLTRFNGTEKGDDGIEL